MAWATGVMKITRLGNDGVKLVADTLDDDAEETYTRFPIDAEALGFVPHHASIISTNATADAYDLALQGSDDAVNWTDIVSNTAKDTKVATTVNFAGAASPTPAAYAHYRFLLVDRTTGAGAPVHTATAHLWR